MAPAYQIILPAPAGKKLQTPTSKLQRIFKFQTSNQRGHLIFAHWSFPECWRLEFGAFF
jgi:hypothetical protein